MFYYITVSDGIVKSSQFSKSEINSDNLIQVNSFIEVGSLYVDGVISPPLEVVNNPKNLSFVEFITHFKLKSGLNSTGLKSILNSSDDDVWLIVTMLKGARSISRDSATTNGGLDLLKSKGLITELEKNAIIDEWPIL